MDLRVATDGSSAVRSERSERESRNCERGAKRPASGEGERSEPSNHASSAERSSAKSRGAEPRDNGEAASSEAGRREASERASGDEGTASSEADARRIVVDREDPTARWRWRCPNRHCDWEPTNSHIWCATCASLHDVDPEYWELLDTKTGERVPWGAVEFR